MKTKLEPQLIAIVCFVAVGLLIGAAGYFTVVAPQGSKAAKIHSDITDAKTELVVAQGAAARPVPTWSGGLFPEQRSAPTMAATTLLVSVARRG